MSSEARSAHWAHSSLIMDSRRTRKPGYARKTCKMAGPCGSRSVASATRDKSTRHNTTHDPNFPKTSVCASEDGNDLKHTSGSVRTVWRLLFFLTSLAFAGLRFNRGRTLHALPSFPSRLPTTLPLCSEDTFSDSFGPICKVGSSKTCRRKHEIVTWKYDEPEAVTKRAPSS